MLRPNDDEANSSEPVDKLEEEEEAEAASASQRPAPVANQSRNSAFGPEVRLSKHRAGGGMKDEDDEGTAAASKAKKRRTHSDASSLARHNDGRSSSSGRSIEGSSGYTGPGMCTFDDVIKFRDLESRLRYLMHMSLN